MIVPEEKGEMGGGCPPLSFVESNGFFLERHWEMEKVPFRKWDSIVDGEKRMHHLFDITHPWSSVGGKWKSKSNVIPYLSKKLYFKVKNTVYTDTDSKVSIGRASSFYMGVA